MTGIADVVEGPWWETKVLSRERHTMLIADRDGIAARAGLGAVYMERIWQPLPAAVSQGERGWMISIVKDRRAPNLWASGSPAAAADRFRWYTGALLRNFVDARIMTTGMIVDHMMDGRPFKATVLFIPDFCIIDESEKRSEPVKRTVLDLVRRRLQQGEITCVYAPKDPQIISRAYGFGFAEEMSTHFPAPVTFK